MHIFMGLAETVLDLPTGVKAHRLAAVFFTVGAWLSAYGDPCLAVLVCVHGHEGVASHESQPSSERLRHAARLLRVHGLAPSDLFIYPIEVPGKLFNLCVFTF